MAFDPISFMIELAIVIALQVVVYVLTPKPKGPKPEAVRDLENPTAAAGRPIPRLFGTALIKGANIVWFGNKATNTFEVKV